MSTPVVSNIRLSDPSGNVKSAFAQGDPMVLDFDYADADTKAESLQDVVVSTVVKVAGQASPQQDVTYAVPVAGYDLSFISSVQDADNAWSKVSEVGGHEVWHGVAAKSTNAGQLTVHVVDAEGNTGSAAFGYTVAAPVPPPPPPPTKTKLGASLNTADDYARLVGLGLTCKAVRIFIPGALPTGGWAGSTLLSSIPADVDIVLTWKVPTPAQVKAFLLTRPSKLTGRLIAGYWHEPEDNFQTAASQATYRSTSFSYGDPIRQAGAIPALILMRATLAPNSGRDWKNFYAPGAVDWLGWDSYNAGNKVTPPTYNDPTQMYSVCKVASDSVKLPWGICETGSPLIGTVAQRAAWAGKLGAAAIAEGAEVDLWWDDGQPGSFDNRLDAKTATAFAGA